jgi:hypothetical protein
MRTLHDSTTAGDIPAGAQMVGGYVDGRYAWDSASWARFPNAVHVPIAVFASTNNGIVLDVEPGCATPAEAPGWVQMRRAAGIDPSVYCNQSALGTVQAAFNAAGVAQPHYWVAHYDNVVDIPAGTVAKQYINDPTSGGHYDLSAVADYWPGIDPAPTTQGADLTTDEHNALMQILNQLMGPWKSKVPGAPDTAAFSLVDWARVIDKNVFEQGAQISGLVAAVAASTTNPAITPAFVQKTIQDAVAQHIQITGTVNIAPATAGGTPA